jgi:MFS family permease
MIKDVDMDDDDDDRPLHERPDEWRYHMLAIFVMNVFVSNFSTGIAGTAVSAVEDFYGIGDDEFSVIYYATYVDFIISAPIWMILQHKYGLRRTMIGATVVMTVGFAIQFFYRYTFWVTVVGAMLTDTCRVLTWITGGLWMSRWFPPDEKSLAFGLVFFAGNLTGLIEFLIARLAMTSADVFDTMYIYILSALIILSAVMVIVTAIWFRGHPKHYRPPVFVVLGRGGRAHHLNWLRPKFDRRSFNYGSLVIHIVVYIFITIANWAVGNLIILYMVDLSFSTQSIFVAGLVYQIVSIGSPLAFGAILDATFAYRIVSFVIVASTTITYAVWVNSFQSEIMFIVTVCVFGFVSGATSLTFSETIMELAFPHGDATTGVLIFWIAQWPAAGSTALASYEVTKTATLWLFMGLYGAATLTLMFGLILQRHVTFQRSWKKKNNLPLDHRRPDGEAKRLLKVVDSK